jgi:hypothetical protein
MKTTLLIVFAFTALAPAVASAQSNPTPEYESNADTAWQNTPNNKIIRGKVTRDPKVDPRGWQPAPQTYTPPPPAPVVQVTPSPDVTRPAGPIPRRRR